MRHKRKSAFRYTFDEPVPAIFYITKINDHAVESSAGEAMIVDISPEGARLSTELKITLEQDKDIEISIKFSLDNVDLTFQGKVVRRKERISTNEYGIAFTDNEKEKEVLITQLKSISKQKYNQDQL